MFGIEGMFAVPCCLFWQTQSLFTLQEGERKGNKTIFVLSQLLSNVKNWKGKINSHCFPAQQQQNEINWEAITVLFILLLGLKWKPAPESILALSQKSGIFLTLVKRPHCVVCYEVFQFEIGGTWVSKILANRGKKLSNADHGFLYYKTGH